MMNNLFSIFDSYNNMFINLNWLSSISNLLILPMMFWFLPSKLMFIMNLLIKFLLSELKNILFNKFNFLNSMIFISIFFFILLNNMLSLYPYIFSSSSHLIFSMSISFPMWISLIIFNFYNNMNNLFAHLIPMSTPMFLMPFMVIIETLSNLIRPMTLMIRLTANIIAGHLLLTLMSNLCSMNLNFSNIIILIQIMMMLLEFSVSIIQSYVFMILLTLYLKETN